MHIRYWMKTKFFSHLGYEQINFIEVLIYSHRTKRNWISVCDFFDYRKTPVFAFIGRVVWQIFAYIGKVSCIAVAQFTNRFSYYSRIESLLKGYPNIFCSIPADRSREFPPKRKFAGKILFDLVSAENVKIFIFFFAYFFPEKILKRKTSRAKCSSHGLCARDIRLCLIWSTFRIGNVQLTGRFSYL